MAEAAANEFFGLPSELLRRDGQTPSALYIQSIMTLIKLRC
jgi:hypothetical protein